MIEVGEMKIRVNGSYLKIARLDGEKFLFASDPQSMIQAVRNSKQRVDLLTFMQKVNETTPKYDYPMEWDNLAVLPVSTFEQWWNEQIGFKARNKAKQAEKKGVVIREVPFDDLLVRGIWEIYNETPVRQGRRFPHFGKDISTVYEEEATYLDRSLFLGAYLGDRLIGFIKLLWDFDGSQAGLLNIVSLIEQRDKAPTNALVAHAVRVCAERKTPFLVYSNFAYGNKGNDTVSDFKERNGFQRVDLPRYFVPLTRLGVIGLKLGLHKRVSERIPYWLAQQLRDMRRSWWHKQTQNATEGS